MSSAFILVSCGCVAVPLLFLWFHCGSVVVLQQFVSLLVQQKQTEVSFLLFLFMLLKFVRTFFSIGGGESPQSQVSEPPSRVYRSCYCSGAVVLFLSL